MSAATTIWTIGEHRVLRDVSWKRYVALRDDPVYLRKRLTYHRGVLENRLTECRTERINRIVETLIDVWSEVHEICQRPFGSTTFRLESASAGLEPDTCYYFDRCREIRGREDLDLRFDPPPDLSIDIVPSPANIDRLAVYADLRFPEVWRIDGERLQIFLLDGSGYQTAGESRALYGFPPEGFMQFVQRLWTTDATTLCREFRTWAAAQTPSAGSDA